MQLNQHIASPLFRRERFLRHSSELLSTAGVSPISRFLILQCPSHLNPYPLLQITPLMATPLTGWATLFGIGDQVLNDAWVVCRVLLRTAMLFPNPLCIFFTLQSIAGFNSGEHKTKADLTCIKNPGLLYACLRRIFLKLTECETFLASSYMENPPLFQFMGITCPAVQQHKTKRNDGLAHRPTSCVRGSSHLFVVMLNTTCRLERFRPISFKRRTGIRYNAHCEDCVL